MIVSSSSMSFSIIIILKCSGFFSTTHMKSRCRFCYSLHILQAHCLPNFHTTIYWYEATHFLFPRCFTVARHSPFLSLIFQLNIKCHFQLF
jgi:hypothetical protein